VADLTQVAETIRLLGVGSAAGEDRQSYRGQKAQRCQDDCQFKPGESPVSASRMRFPFLHKVSFLVNSSRTHYFVLQFLQKPEYPRQRATMNRPGVELLAGPRLEQPEYQHRLCHGSFQGRNEIVSARTSD